jgi:uncharacterized protein YukE
MIIKANYKELLDAGTKLKKEGENLNSEVDNLLAVLEKVKTSWVGTDSEIFTGKAEAYFKNIKQLSGSIDEFSNFIKYAENAYETRDLRWKKEIEEAGARFGDEELKHKDQQ